MITNYRLLPALLLALSIIACTASAAGWTKEDRAAITAMGDLYLEALVDNDMTKLASLFVEDGIRLVNNGPITQSHAAIQSLNLTTDFISFRTDNITIGGQGDVAYSWMDYDLTSVISEGAEPSTFYGRFLTVLRKQADGSWLFVAFMFNERPSP